MRRFGLGASDTYPALLADVGGSNARFAWLAAADAEITDIVQLPVAEHAGPLAAASTYLAQVQQRHGAAWRAPRRAAWALAADLGAPVLSLTNSGWVFEPEALCSALALDQLILLNDFEALALALPRLRPAQLRSASALLPPQGVLAVLGPGTGLGVAGLVQSPMGWLALPGEGGHATLAPADDFESALLAWVRQCHAHVSAERLLSGIGLPLLARAVAAVSGAAEPGWTSEQIVSLGQLAPDQGGDPLCRQTLERFCALLGGFAGSVALTLGAQGGVYIGGGIVPRMADFFFASDFRARFEAKGRFRDYLQRVPTVLITDTMAALDGAAQSLQPHSLS